MENNIFTPCSNILYLKNIILFEKTKRAGGVNKFK